MTYISDKLREQVRQRANGRCEYCGKPENVNTFSHQVDHVIPEDHTGTSEYINLAWACFRCNNGKGRDIASIDEETKQLTPLYNPRTQNWNDHFEMNAEAVIVGKTPIGRVTVRLLEMNRERQIEIRRNLIEEGRW
jgi:hypothetical protein